MKRKDRMTPEQFEKARESYLINGDSCEGCIKYNDERFHDDERRCFKGTCAENVDEYLNEPLRTYCANITLEFRNDEPEHQNYNGIKQALDRLIENTDYLHSYTIDGTWHACV